MIKVGVIGAAGRMGSETCRAVEAADDLELVARVTRDDDLNDLVRSGTEVAVEFSTPATVGDNARFCVSNGIHVVVGATGLAPEDLSRLEAAAKRGTGIFVAPNFAFGAVLMMRFSAQAARLYERAEIVERHGVHKLDAPSGTAARTASLIAEARQDDSGSVPIHSLRLPGSVAHQEVIFGGTGETLTIRHDSLDRASFMPGVLLAIREVGSMPGLTVGLEALLDL